MESSSPIKTGSFIANLTKSSTFLVWVAENRTVCLSYGKSLRIWLISCSNPCCKIWSASSTINILRFETFRVSVLIRWSKSLPGVATMILVPLVSLMDSVFLLEPPMIRLEVLLVNLVRSYKTSKICWASSLTGEIIMIPVPSFWVNLILSRTSRAGTKNAKVLPDPVLAAPTRSLLLRI